MNSSLDLPIEYEKSLLLHNTFGFSQNAEYFVETRSDEQLVTAIKLAKANRWPVFILGGGSNIILTGDIPGLTIHLADDSVNYDPSGTTYKTCVTVRAGKRWQQLVLESLENNLRGLENLSLIPGSVGAAPVQNIGAFGVELQNIVTRVRALHIGTMEWHNFTNEQCQFSYRNSYFKSNTNQYVITEVDLELGDCNPLVYDYASLAKHLSSRGIIEPDANHISQSVIAVRESRLPNPTVLANAGSFFHNPVISKEYADKLRKKYPDIVTYDIGPSLMKVSAAWMIEQLGFKGTKEKHVGVHKDQALVLVHFGEGTGDELLVLANKIQTAVLKYFGIQLQIEPAIL